MSKILKRFIERGYRQANSNDMVNVSDIFEPDLSLYNNPPKDSTRYHQISERTVLYKEIEYHQVQITTLKNPTTISDVERIMQVCIDEAMSCMTKIEVKEIAMPNMEEAISGLINGIEVFRGGLLSNNVYDEFGFDKNIVNLYVIVANADLSDTL